MQDDELIARIEAGDEAALSELFERHAPNLTRVALMVLGDPAAAEDVVQDLFVRLWDDPSIYDPSRGPLAGFLRMTVRSRSLDAGRKTRAYEKASERAAERRPEVLRPLSRADKTGLEDALDVLPEEQRELLHRLYYQGQTQKQIAEELGLPLGTVKSRMRLGMERMREHFRQAQQRTMPRLRGRGQDEAAE
ncbi:MAG TPA: RNA polymerase subunit sigma-24 [Planctomycetes bacterium]|nr:RNA polymerase subunit sigma-24 [Planctomycetota bacterium]